jgi:hypothetical protein
MQSLKAFIIFLFTLSLVSLSDAQGPRKDQPRAAAGTNRRTG